MICMRLSGKRKKRVSKKLPRQLLVFQISFSLTSGFFDRDGIKSFIAEHHDFCESGEPGKFYALFKAKIEVGAVMAIAADADLSAAFMNMFE